jgi:hypothetical protein
MITTVNFATLLGLEFNLVCEGEILPESEISIEVKVENTSFGNLPTRTSQRKQFVTAGTIIAQICFNRCSKEHLPFF